MSDNIKHNCETANRFVNAEAKWMQSAFVIYKTPPELSQPMDANRLE